MLVYPGSDVEKNYTSSQRQRGNKAKVYIVESNDHNVTRQRDRTNAFHSKNAEILKAD